MKTCKLLSLVAVAMFMALPSCYTPKKAKKKFGCVPQTTRSDSISKSSETSSSSTTFIENSVSTSPSVNLHTSINPCDSLGHVNKNLQMLLQSGKGSLNISGKNGTLEIDCNCDSSVDQLHKEIYTKDSIIKVMQVDKSKEVISVVAPTEAESADRWITMYITIPILGLGWLFYFYQILNGYRRSKRNS